MAAEGSDEQRSFKVQDRRRFSETGEAREQPAAAESAEAPPSESAQREASRSEYTRTSAGEIEITFTTFVLGLSTQALALLGEIPHPEDGAVRMDLPAARQIIDILGILQDKTRGNLDSGEGPLLDGVLYDLRMKFVERSRPR